MKKNNFKGFMLVETLIVTVFVCTVLIFLFTLVQGIEKNFERTYSYNPTSSLYAARNIKDYLLNNYLEGLIKDYVESPDPYFDITDCSIKYYASSAYCTKLYEKLNVRKVLFLTSDFYEVKYTDVYSSRLNQEFIDFIDYTNEDSDGDKYRIVVSFSDGTFATVKFKGDNLYDE